MRRKVLATVGSIAAAIMVPSLASAQTAQQRTWCYDQNATDAQTIDGCTAMILSAGLSGRELAILYYDRGLSYENTSQFALALSDFNNAIQLDPSYFEALDDRGNVMFKTGDSARAIADYDRALEAKPDYALAFSNRGWVYYTKGQFDLAGQDLDRSISLGINQGRTFVDRALVRIERHDCDGAAQDYQKAKQLNWKFTISDKARATCGAALTAAGL